MKQSNKKRTKRIHLVNLLIIPIAAIVLFSRPIYEHDGLIILLETLAFLLIISAALGRIWASAYLSGKKNTELVVNGPYSIVRNPLYFFSFLGFIGAGLLFGSVSVAILLGMIFLVTHLPVILREETRLRVEFGEQFEAYMQQVPRLWPRLGHFSIPQVTSLHTRSFHRAILESSLLLGLLALSELFETINKHPDWPVFFVLP